MKRRNSGIAPLIIMGLIWLVLFCGFWGGLAYIALHFLAKLW